MSVSWSVVDLFMLSEAGLKPGVWPEIKDSTDAGMQLVFLAQGALVKWKLFFSNSVKISAKTVLISLVLYWSFGLYLKTFFFSFPDVFFYLHFVLDGDLLLLLRRPGLSR